MALSCTVFDVSDIKNTATMMTSSF